MRARLAAVALLSAAALAPAGGSSSAAPLPQAKRCPMFPKAFATNRTVASAAVRPDSASIIDSIGRERGLHADFGSGLWEGKPIGIPFDVVSKRTRRSRVIFGYADESDRVGYPIPRGVHIEGGGDRHALLVDEDRCRLYELFALERVDGRWRAGSGATWNLRSTKLRPAGWTSADAAGLPILPLLARYDEVRRGVIDHALRITVRRSRRAYVHPARHFASGDADPSLPRMGERLRLRPGIDPAGFPAQARPIVRAMQRYGVIVADNGSDWFLSGAPDPRWDNEQLQSLGRIEGSDFEVVTSG